MGGDDAGMRGQAAQHDGCRDHFHRLDVEHEGSRPEMRPEGPDRVGQAADRHRQHDEGTACGFRQAAQGDTFQRVGRAGRQGKVVGAELEVRAEMPGHQASERAEADDAEGWAGGCGEGHEQDLCRAAKPEGLPGPIRLVQPLATQRLGGGRRLPAVTGAAGDRGGRSSGLPFRICTPPWLGRQHHTAWQPIKVASRGRWNEECRRSVVRMPAYLSVVSCRIAG